MAGESGAPDGQGRSVHIRHFQGRPEVGVRRRGRPAENHNLTDSTNGSAEQDAALSRRRSLVDETMDFEAIVAEQAVDMHSVSKQYALKSIRIVDDREPLPPR